MPRLHQRLISNYCISRPRHSTLSIAVILLLALIVWNATARRPRIWTVVETPIAFWSWRSETPSETDVSNAVRQTGAKTLFLRAGQIDSEKGKLNRIRRVAGTIPRAIEIHFVYNATRSFLREFDQINEVELSSTVLSTFAADVDRAKDDQATVIGLQLDFDIPTRLLLRYASLLKKIRQQLPEGSQLSITGLPTWLDSPALVETLSACDFWVPQYYGAQIPDRIEQRIPITSRDLVARSVSRTRNLGVPFYAGLAAYGYAIHYSKDGSLIGLRGDLDPLLVVANEHFDLIDQAPFLLASNDTSDNTAVESRSIYRARRDVVVDGTTIQTGESLLLDRPTAAGLRACARAVREHSGARLRGICVFRIPSQGDSTTLTLSEIAHSLSDTEPRFSLEAQAWRLADYRSENNVILVLEFENNGTATSKPGGNAITILVRIPHGGLSSISADQHIIAEPVFESRNGPVRCAIQRANAVKLTATWWPPGARMTARLETKNDGLGDISLRYSAHLDDGTVVEASRTLKPLGVQ